MRKATEEWLASARDDLETVEELIDNDQLTHIVAFHAHSKSTSSPTIFDWSGQGATVY